MLLAKAFIRCYLKRPSEEPPGGKVEVAKPGGKIDGQAGRDLQDSHSDSGTGTGTGATSCDFYTPWAGGRWAEKGHLTAFN